MPLILAVEPNTIQAQQLASLVRQHLKAELVTAPSADAALAALGDRVPDLILTPALLGLRDEAALTERLRDLGPAASHVQTLAVPILSAGAARPAVGGLLGLKRDRDETADIVGCEPSLFAEQIQIYLERAAVERAAQDPPAVSRPAAERPAAVEDAGTSAGDASFTAGDAAFAAAMESDLPGEDGVAITVIGEEDVPLLEAEAVPEPGFDVTPDVHVGLPVDLDPPREPPAVVPAPPAPLTPPPRTPTPETRAMEVELGLVMPATAAPPLWRVAEGIEDFYSGADGFRPADEPPAVSPADEPAAIAGTEPAVVVETVDGAEDERSAPPAAPTVEDDIIELELDDALAAAVASDAAMATEEATVLVAPPTTPFAGAPPAPPSRPRKAAPPLDDWAYFDPSQSPFRALVRRLDEVAGERERHSS